MNICGLTCISVVLGFLKRNTALQSVRVVGYKDSSFSPEPTEHKPEHYRWKLRFPAAPLTFPSV